jgi:hypothetical protein
MTRTTIISIHWESSLPEYATIYVSGEKIPDVIVNKVIDSIIEHNAGDKFPQCIGFPKESTD